MNMDFNGLYEQHYGKLFSVAYRLTGRKEDAEDVIQEAFLNAYKAYQEFQGKSMISTWLYKIVVNCSYRYIKKQKKLPVVDISSGFNMSQNQFFEMIKSCEPVEDEVLTNRENSSLASFHKIFNKHFLKRKYEKDMATKLSMKLNIKAPSIETNVLMLSGGNQQKVVLAKWLMSDVKILFLDEPTRGIDVGAKVEIYNIMTELARSGVAIIMISSELPELLAMCDRFIILAGGTINSVCDRQEISQEIFMKAATGICTDI